MSAKTEEAFSPSPQSEELMDMHQKNKVFAQELMAENERLRYRIVHLEKELLEQQPQHLQHDLQQLQEENQRLREKLAFLEKRFTTVEEENKDFAQRYLEVETQNENLLNLYVASYQLHSTLDPQEVVNCIKEILINLIGTEEFGVYLLDEENNDLVLSAHEGALFLKHERIAFGEDLEGTVAAKGESFFTDNVGPEGEVCICIPLKIRERVVGLIAIYRLLSHKSNLNALDHQLMHLLAAQAATALVSSKLYANADRKLRIVEGFMSLLRAK